MDYRAPVKDMMFVLNELAGIDKIAKLPGFEDARGDTAQAILEESDRFSGKVIAPLNVTGDHNPSTWKDGVVTATAGFGAAFRQFSEAGWQGIQHPKAYGGQDLPKLIATPCMEMLHAANISFALCPMLTDAAIEALLTAGSESQRNIFVPKLIAGEWTGTMNLTEPQAGSDLAAVRTRAIPQSDGSFRIYGTKIFITWGEHDMVDNIVHLVLARTPNSPEGVKGISLFLVSKFRVKEDGSLGDRNDVHCVSIEHKLGIKASPTAVLQFGDNGGAVGHLVGEENHGLEYMFIMMNAARFAVGMQGVAISDRAYQHAASYARNRIQSSLVDGSTKQAVAIIEHPDVRRMLATMRALTEASRALAYVAASHCDIAHHDVDDTVRAEHKAIYEYLVPIVKGWGTELSLEVTSLGVQVHGGMGFVEETGAAQYYRDARILPIYEGTTAIQANDLVSRKTIRDGGAVAKLLLTEIHHTLQLLEECNDAASLSMRRQLALGHASYASVVEFILATIKMDPNAVFVGSVLYLKLAGIVLGGWHMARALIASKQKRSEDPLFYDTKIATAQFYAEHLLPYASALEGTIISARGTEGILALDAAAF